MSTARRSSALVRRAMAPATLFGAGYGVSWVQHREESACQLASAAVLKGFAGMSEAARQLAKSMPAELTWPREQLAKAAQSELRVLVDAVEMCSEKGCDSTILHAAALERLCLFAKEDPMGLAVGGLGTDPFRDLLRAIDTSASKMNGPACADHLVQLASALRSLIEAHGSAWGKDATPDGVVHLAHISMVATSWLADLLHNRKVGSLPCRLSLEEEQAAIKDLTYVWQSLQQLPTSSRLGAGKLSEGQEAYKDLKARFSSLQAWKQPPSADMLRPMEEALPSKLRTSIAAAMAGRGMGWFSYSGGMPPAPPTANPTTPTTPPAAAPTTSTPTTPPTPAPTESMADLEEATTAVEELKSSVVGKSDVVAAAASKDATPDDAKQTTNKSWQRVAVELAAAGILVFAGVVVLSDDGFGILQSVRLVPTKPGRNELRSEVIRRAVNAEDLAARDTLTNFERESVLVTGPTEFENMTDSFVEIRDV